MKKGSLLRGFLIPANVRDEFAECFRDALPSWADQLLNMFSAFPF